MRKCLKQRDRDRFGSYSDLTSGSRQRNASSSTHDDEATTPSDSITSDQAGATMVEYSLILLIASLAGLIFLGPTVAAKFNHTATVVGNPLLGSSYTGDDFTDRRPL